jgi:hypothetical protein
VSGCFKTHLLGQSEMVEAIVPAIVYIVRVVDFGLVAAVPLDVT